MATIDHLILNVNEIASSVEFYVGVLGLLSKVRTGHSL